MPDWVRTAGALGPPRFSFKSVDNWSPGVKFELMPITKTIIQEIVREEIKSQLVPINRKLDQLANDTDQKFEAIDQRFDAVDERFAAIDEKFNAVDEKFEVIGGKLDKLTEIVVDLAGQFRKFDEEQTVLSGQVSNLTDRVEKLELAIN